MKGRGKECTPAFWVRVSRCPLSGNIADVSMADLKFVLKDKQVTEEMKYLMK